MIKKKPAYSLDTAKQLIQSDSTRKIALGALKGADSLGYSEEEIVRFFLTLERKDYFKAETQHNNHKIWHDYYSKHDGDKYIFIKFKLLHDDIVIILTSFKEDTNKATQED